MIDKILNLQNKIIPNKSILTLIYLLLLCASAFKLGALYIVMFILYSYFSIVRNKLPKIDKLQHFYMGLIYTLISLFLLNGIYIVIPCLVLGAVKEVKDYFGSGTPEVLDVLFTVYPSILIFLILQ